MLRSRCREDCEHAGPAEWIQKPASQHRRRASGERTCVVTVFCVTLYKCFDSEWISFLLRLYETDRERWEQTQRRETRAPFYELTPCSNEYKWALICSTLHGWWRAVCDTSRPGSTDTTGANHYPFSGYLSPG